MFTTGLARLVDGFDAARPAPSTPPVAVREPAPRRAWPRAGGAELWAPASAALDRPGDERVLDLDRDLGLDHDLASLPHEDAGVDRVVSAFGPMFSSDGRAAIDEMFRVVRPGGVVAFTAWTSLGAVGRLLRLAATHEPSPGVPAPLTWGREERLRQELERHGDDVRLEARELALRFESGEEAVARLIAGLGPLAQAARPDELRERATQVIDELAVAEPGGVRLAARYLLAEAVRRPVLY